MAKATAEEIQPLKQQDASDKVFDDESDPELEKNGGPYQKKYAFLQVTFRLPLDGPGHFCVLVYGFLPFVVPATFLIHWLIHRHFLGLYGFLVSIVTSLLNELVFKPIVKDPRPVESANKFKDPSDGVWKMKPGMPSGHVLNATTIMVWALLEIAFKGPGYHKHMYTTLEWLAFILVLMAPVPWARWKNKDHTLKQCLVAGALGVLAGIGAFLLRTMYFSQVWKPWPMEHMPSVNGTNATVHT